MTYFEFNLARGVIGNFSLNIWNGRKFQAQKLNNWQTAVPRYWFTEKIFAVRGIDALSIPIVEKYLRNKWLVLTLLLQFRMVLYELRFDLLYEKIF